MQEARAWTQFHVAGSKLCLLPAKSTDAGATWSQAQSCDPYWECSHPDGKPSCQDTFSTRQPEHQPYPLCVKLPPPRQMLKLLDLRKERTFQAVLGGTRAWSRRAVLQNDTRQTSKLQLTDRDSLWLGLLLQVVCVHFNCNLLRTTALSRKKPLFLPKTPPQMWVMVPPIAWGTDYANIMNSLLPTSDLNWRK